MKSFLKRLSIFILIPFVTMLAGYLYFDPFKVVYKYEDYGNSNVVLCRDYVSSQYYLDHKEECHYDSFIFGSSRTIGFKASAWKKYLDKKASVYTFDASAESIYGIHSKLKYIDRHNVKIKNVLIILCRDWMAVDKSIDYGHIFQKHPEFCEKNWVVFHGAMFKAYLDIKFLFAFYKFQFSGVYTPSMKNYLTNEPFLIASKTNEIIPLAVNPKYRNNMKQFVIDNDSIFYDRVGCKMDSIDRLNENNIVMLKEIKQILEKRKVNYKIVASPLYDQIRFSKKDKSVLNALFSTNFYDYTGKNKYTNNKENYYEASHFRPNVGVSIFKEIYHNNPK
jgi:hypothetical protein